jgi:hypothetical protein
MALVMILTFMPALTFADDTAPVEEIQQTQTDEYVPIKPGELRLYDEQNNIVENPEQFLTDNNTKFPTKVEYQYYSGEDVPFVADYQEPVLRSSSFYQWGRQFVVTYSDGSSEIYSCVYTDDFSDCDYYVTNPAGDPDKGKPVGNAGWFWNMAADGKLFTKTNKTALLYMSSILTVAGKEYYLQKACDNTVEATTGPAEISIMVRGTGSNFYTEYTGKKYKITKKKLEIWTSNYVEPNITKISPSSVTSIGSHKITFSVENKEGLFGDKNPAKVVDWFVVCPKKVTNAKMTNPKKNTIKLSWTYELKSKKASKAKKAEYKANYKKIDGYMVEVYDTDFNEIATKVIKKKSYKNKKTVTIKSKKLKKGKKYVAYIYAYKNVKGDTFRSDAVIKKLKLKK